ncbi:MAG: glycerophosphodiester phosphodiesterase [Halobacteriovoraceae bacterium]|jgi:glycerophosphoryl diester phosphodiesterase|nr:glycerophosphodiester phosphodiesterase [Halobacteriovoraceae bacterium]
MTKLFLILGLLTAFSASASECIAHRGNSSVELENSLKAIRSAVEVGADGVEFDVYHSSDEVPFIWHDKKLKRLARNRPGFSCPLDTEVTLLKWQQIKNNCLLKNGDEIPSLKNILVYLEFKNIRRFIEFKDRPTHKTLKMIEKYNLQRPDLVSLISFKRRFLRPGHKLRKHSPWWKKVKFLNVNKFWQNPISKYGIDVHFISMPFSFISRLFGRNVGVWTINTKKLLKKAFKKKIKYITTNKPELCLELRSKN